MMKQSVIFLLLGALLSSCGAFDAASNSDRKKDDDGAGRDGEPQDNPAPQTRFASAEEMRFALNTQMFRDRGTDIYKYAQERDFFLENQLPATLHPVPDKQFHDMDARTTRPNDAVDCGLDIAGSATIDRRIADCIDKNEDNPAAYSWDGEENGISGESDWQLVAHKNGRSVWMDIATGLLWSPPIAANTWERASGNVSEAEQVCNAANDNDFFLGIALEEASWRLPTRNDYLQADLNGSRYVLSIAPEGDDQVYWTANYISGESKAWAIQHNTGILEKRSEDSPAAIRCVGNVVKFN